MSYCLSRSTLIAMALAGSLLPSQTWFQNRENIQIQRPSITSLIRTPALGYGSPSPCFGALSSTHIAFAETSKSRRFMPTAGLAIDKTHYVEPATGLEFPMSLTLPGGTMEVCLCGTGVREKTVGFIAVKVYAVAFYAEPKMTKLAPWNKKPEDGLLNDINLWTAITEAPLEKGLVIVLARDVEGQQFWKALEETLTPRLKLAGPHADKALHTFGEVLKERSLKKGTTIYFNWVQPSTLKISLSDDGSLPLHPTAIVESKQLISALFDVYLGAKTVSSSLKSSIVEYLKHNT